MVASILDNPDELAAKIRESTGISAEELELKIAERQKEYGGLLTRAGAAYSIAKDMGIVVARMQAPKHTVSELSDGMRDIDIEGEITDLFPIHVFERDGRKGSVRNVVLKDETGSIKVAIWGPNSEKDLRKGSHVGISRAYTKGGELHIGESSSISEKAQEVSKIRDLRKGDTNKTIRAVVVGAYPPKILEVCAACGAMLRGKCTKCGQAATRKTPILNVELDDGSSVIRATLYRELAEDFMGLKAEELSRDQKLFDYKKTQLLGRERMFVGDIRENDYLHSNDFVIRSFDYVNVENEIERLSA